MKVVFLTFLITISFVCSGNAMMDEQVGEVCVVWAEYNTEKTVFDMTKKNMEEQGVDINEVDRESVLRVRALKARFDREKRKFETKTKRKFRSNLCQ